MSIDLKQILVILIIKSLFVLPITAQEIHDAVQAGDIDRVKTLLENEPRLASKKDKNDMTPLHWACLSGYKEIAELLIAKGADINTEDKWGLTPLSRSNQIGKRDIVNLLLEHGADLPEDEWIKRKYAHHAAMHGHKRLLERLVNGDSGINMSNPNGGTLLHSAAEGGSVETAEILIRKGIPVNQRDRYGYTALHYAVLNGYLDVVEVLAAKGADLNIRTMEGTSALNFAEEGNRPEVVEFLEARGVDQSPRRFPVLQGEYLGQEKPGREPEIFSLGIISSNERCHSSLAFSPDGKAVYWSPGWLKMLFMKLEQGRWTPPRIPPFESEYGETEPLFSRDGQNLFFLSKRPLVKNGEDNKENIWYIERVDDGWSEPKPFSPIVNSMNLHWQFSFADNRNIYFGSDQAGGKGGSDIYVSNFKNGAYTKPINLGNVINTSYEDFSPYIAPDESYLILTRQGDPKKRDADLCISYRQEDGSWAEVVNMGQRMNSKQSDYCPMVSPDGKYLFFVSNRNGNQDIYWVDAKIIENLKPKELK